MKERPRGRSPARLPSHSMRRQGGYALFFVLSLILLLSLLLTGLTRDSRGQARAALRTLEAAQARANAETALSLAIMRLLAARPQDRWQADGQERSFDIGDIEWRVTVTPEDGKVDINHAPPALLAELFTAAGSSPGEAQGLADRVADWRDADDLTHVNGAEGRAYESANLPPPRNGPFLRVSELRQVMGMTERLYACISGAVTVHSGKEGFDRRFAPPLLQKQQDESGTGPTAVAHATSPLAVESVAGKSIAVRLTQQDSEQAKTGSIFVIRLTDNPASPWWLLSSQSVRPGPAEASSGCVSSPPHPHPEGEKPTTEG